jgi:hypothetical protein
VGLRGWDLDGSLGHWWAREPEDLVTLVLLEQAGSVWKEIFTDGDLLQHLRTTHD